MAKCRFVMWLLVVSGLCLVNISANAQSIPTTSSAPTKGNLVTKQATGTFEVKLAPQEDGTGESAIGRMSIDKQFHGDLEGTSKGQMLSFMTAVKGSAGYVAMEKVSGTLSGKSGSFVLQHSATMDRGTPQLSITVVPDSATRQLEGLTGKMNIIIKEGKHSYEFDYSLPTT
jgi:Protein of unknown function (DUF3224)